MESFCTHRGLSVDEWISDIGSGLNYKRKGLCKLIDLVCDGKIKAVVIAHKDRLVRFGFDHFYFLFQRFGTDILIMNQESLSPEEEMVQDLMSIVHCFSCRLYGLRSYKKVIRDAASKKNKTDGKSRDG